MNFSVFKNAVAKQFAEMQKHALYRANVDKDTLWATYLESHPEGTNEVYRVRAQADCSCCKQFIRAIGNVVAIIDSKIVSIWDIQIPEEPAFQIVANALSALIKAGKPVDEFFHYEKTAGTDKNFEEIEGNVHTWQHFFVNIKPQFVLPKDDIASTLGASRAIREVLLRGLKTITMDSISTVQDLTAQNSLYRGEDHAFAVEEFRKLKIKFDKLETDEEREAFSWHQAKIVHGAVAKIRNSAIGTLLQDLSENKDLEDAVNAFEKNVMAPGNYKRSTALITPAMVQSAKEKIEELGLTSALQRRYANINDITVNNVLFVNREIKNIADLDVFDSLATTTVTSKKLDKVEEISIDKFIADILPRANSLEVLLENRHASNMVSLIAPVDPTAGQLMKWGNGFSWSYAGEVTDSIKERVKKAGGSVEGDLCCRLAWDYEDDLDLHMHEPDGNQIYYHYRRQLSACGGMLDLDANGLDGIRSDPSENIFYKNRNAMKEGVYTLLVNNYTRRSDGVGFEVEIEFDGQIHHISYPKALRTAEHVTVVKIKYSKAQGFEIIESLPSTATSKDLWNLKTQTFVPLKAMMLSPNFWDDNTTGNKSWFFMLENCVNDSTVRGFYNEFLKEELMPHRKVFEVLAAKTKPEHTENQLSGLGFSVSQRNSLTCRVKGSFSRIIKIIF